MLGRAVMLAEIPAELHGSVKGVCADSLQHCLSGGCHIRKGTVVDGVN
jgi:hypothetical protein